jgi:hypothetical protein
MSQREVLDALAQLNAFSKKTAVPSRILQDATGGNRNVGDNLARLRKSGEIKYYSEYSNSRFYYWLPRRSL